MNVLIFGASGATGQELVKQALAQGHFVTAFVRSPAKLNMTHDHLKIIQGNIKDYPSVEQAMNEQDAVLSALGVSSPLKKDPIVVEGVRNIIKAMKETHVKRLVYLSTMGVRESRQDTGFLSKNIIVRILHNQIEDHEEKEDIVKNSHIEWTIVRPPALTNGSKKEVYRSGEDIKARSILPTCSRADVADFMLKQLNDHTFIHKAPRIMY